ncbi:hypothetical protein NLJ89_g4144 [Agrocybe chaxingu]|uniref:Uncharacterized protein n=1 Tax=Agrocybe chaxingu TaxID=84603 RepID=A0A9W8K134_9AGAR|nr:hypothetical protein NLJ89_g4144 [Agrocybe chaxingu]
MLTKRVVYSMGSRYWDEPSTMELIMIILNYVACIPVLLAVGGFRLAGNTTTIEGWEKDKVATLVRRGKTQEVKFPYDLGVRRNIKSVLGPSPLLWCWPSRTPGNGLRYELSNKDGESWPPKEPSSDSSTQSDRDSALNSSPWTYENESLNPALRATNSQMREPPSARRRRRKADPGTSPVPPYHPDYQEVPNSRHEPEVYSEGSEGSDDEHSPAPTGRVHVRRGSEGYEVRPIGREEMLHRYLEELGEEPGRYLRYIPQPESESDDDDDIPLAYQAKKVKAN